MQNNLIIFIKNPVKGKVKTRIAKDVGDDVALNIYKDLLIKTQAIVKEVNAKLYLYYSDFINKNDEWSNTEFEKQLQSSANIGQRMEMALGEVSGKTILIGSDCFDLTSDIIEEAFAKLEEVDLVLGPANDGGYYLIGMNEFHPKLFRNINWSTEEVLSQTVKIAKHQKLSFDFLVELVDLDTLSDIGKSGYNLDKLEGIKMEKELKETLNFLQSKGVNFPIVGIVLGTGLGNLAEMIEAERIIEYKDIPHFPISTVESHSGKLIYGQLGGKQVLAMQGRFHYYEGYDVAEITYPIRVMKLLGVEKLLISNAAGTVNPDFKKGGLMLIDDHINLIPDNPLRGKNIDNFGPRFPDMSQPYDADMNKLLIEIAQNNGITLYKGVYTPVAGPNLETRAEYRYLRRIGSDAVGMSTAPEVIVANHMSLPCAAISVLTDECDPDNLKPVSITEILEIAAKAEKDLTRLYVALIEKL